MNDSTPSDETETKSLGREPRAVQPEAPPEVEASEADPENDYNSLGQEPRAVQPPEPPEPEKREGGR